MGFICDLLRVLCFSALCIAITLLSRGSTTQESLLLFFRTHWGAAPKLNLLLCWTLGICLAWRCLGFALGSITFVEAERDVTVGISTALAARVVNLALGFAEEHAQLRRFVAEHETTHKELARVRIDRDDLAQQVSQGQADVVNWKTTANKLEVQVAAIRKQAEGTTDEYMRLMTENKSLRNQLEDFDLVLGDSRKKAA